MANEMEKLVKDWTAAWNSHDAEKAIKFYTDDATLDNNYEPGGHHGKPEVLAAMKALLADMPDFKVELKTTFYSPGAVCGEVIFSGTHSGNKSMPFIPVTGKKFAFPGAYVSEWQNGKVKRHTVYADMMGFMAQLGVLPPPAKK